MQEGHASEHALPSLSLSLSLSQLEWSSPGELVPLRRVSALIIYATVRLDAGSEQALAHHLWNHHHADVFAQTFMTAETEVKIVIPVAAGDELVGIFKRLRI